ncbi:MAG: GNAT family N-acetyltransferase [Firmicutes bacterium]|nr:GNAT family N-acetyltransferase [Bacillota bacterium]
MIVLKKKKELSQEMIDACERLVSDTFYDQEKCGLVSRFQTMLKDGDEVLLYDIDGEIQSFLIIGTLNSVNPSDILKEPIQYHNNLFLVQLAVAKKYQHQGIGSQLMKYAMDIYQNRGICYLWVTSTNYKAKNCYQKLGFEEIGIFQGEYEFIKNYKAYLMRLKLKLKNILHFHQNKLKIS